MNLIINITMAILLTSLTGTVIFGIWYLIGQVFKRYGYLDVLYQILMVSYLFWLLPIAYIEILVLNESKWGNLLFSRSPLIDSVSIAFFVVWLCGVCTLTIKYIYNGIVVSRRLKKTYLVDGEIYDLFCDVCSRLSISTEGIELGFDYAATSPCIGGLKKPYVILPNLEYSTEQLEVIFLHELTHYRKKNHIIRHLVQLVCVFHYFNPFVWIYKNRFKFWGEYTCDYEVIPKTQGVDFYFETINMIAKTPSVVDYLEANLFESKSELAGRCQMMERSFHGKRQSKWLASAVSVVMICLSSLSIQAATITVADNYCNLYLQTAEYYEEETIVNDYQEFYSDQLKKDVVTEEWQDSEKLSYEVGRGYKGNIGANTAKLGDVFYVEAGKKVAVSAVEWGDSGSIMYQLGLMKQDGSIVYIKGTAMSGYQFDINESGYYRAYVQNIADSTYEISVMLDH